MRSLIALPIALTIVVPSRAYSQTQRTLQGIVRDSATGETLPSATIVVSGTDRRAQTNRDGFFALVGVAAQELSLRVTAIGYRSRQMTVAEDWPGTELLTIRLVGIPYELTAIDVVADETRMVRGATDGVSQVIASPEGMATMPSIGETDIFRSLQLLPGISGSNENSSGLYIRGGTPDQNLVLLDGMTVYHVDHFFGFFSAFNADAIKDVKVFKGPYPAQYGGRVASVVDMTGRSGDPNSPHVAAGANLLSSQLSGQVPLFGRGSLLVSARRSYTDVLRTGVYSSIFGLFDGQDNGPGLTAGGPVPVGNGPVSAGRFANANQAVVQPDFYFYDVNAKLTYLPSARDVIAITAYTGEDKLDNSRSLDQSFATQTTDFNRGLTNDITDLTDWGNRGLSGKWARQWNARLYSDALVAYSEYFSDYDRTTEREDRDLTADTLISTRRFGNVESNLVQDMSVRLNNEWQALHNLKVQFGGAITRSNVDYSFVRDDTLSILDRHQEATDAAGYLQNEWHLSRGIMLTAGAHLAHYDRTAETFIEPRISASVGLTPALTLKGGLGRYHQAVNRVVNENVSQGSRDFWLLADDELVEVMTSTHYVLGATYETGQWLFDVEAYRKTLDGLSEFSLRFTRSLTPDPIDLFFDGTGVARGLEILAQKKHGALTGWVGYTLSSVQHTFPDLNGGEPFAALHDQTHELKTVGNYALGRWTFSTTWTFATGKPYTAPESEYTLTLLDGTEQSYIHVGAKNALRLPAYHRMDVAAHYRFPVGVWHGDIGLSVFNVYDRANIWYREFDLSESPLLITDVTYLGITPNLSVRFEF